jgi:hypothetical protein
MNSEPADGTDDSMILTSADRIIAALFAVYTAYRLWSGWGDGVIYGDGDDDVRADEHPTAFVVTALSVVLIIGTLTCVAIGSDAAKLAALAAWLWKL